MTDEQGPSSLYEAFREWSDELQVYVDGDKSAWDIFRAGAGWESARYAKLVEAARLRADYEHAEGCQARFYPAYAECHCGRDAIEAALAELDGVKA